MEDTQDLGQRLRAARERKGWSMRFLAGQAGLSASFLSDLEGGKRNPSGANVAILCRAVDVSADWLLGLDVGEIPTEPEHAAQALVEALREVQELREWKRRARAWYSAAHQAMMDDPPGPVSA